MSKTVIAINAEDADPNMFSSIEDDINNLLKPLFNDYLVVAPNNKEDLPALAILSHSSPQALIDMIGTNFQFIATTIEYFFSEMKEKVSPGDYELMAPVIKTRLTDMVVQMLLKSINKQSITVPRGTVIDCSTWNI